MAARDVVVQLNVSTADGIVSLAGMHVPDGVAGVQGTLFVRTIENRAFVEALAALITAQLGAELQGIEMPDMLAAFDAVQAERAADAKALVDRAAAIEAERVALLDAEQAAAATATEEGAARVADIEAANARALASTNGGVVTLGQP